MAIDHTHIRGGAIAALVSEKKWGGPTRLNTPQFISLTNTRQRLLPNNPKRVQFTMVSLNTADVVVGASGAGLGTLGLNIGRKGGYLIVTADEDGELVTQEWWGISNSYAGNMVVWEVEII